MGNPLGGNGGFGGDEPPIEQMPALLDALRGQQAGLQQAMVKNVQDLRGIDPKQFTGNVDGDPRNGDIYPDGVQEQAELLTGESPGVLTEEFQMHLQATKALRVDTLPPEPLTPTDLDDLLQRLAAHCGVDESDYEAWIPIEPEHIDDTAVGEYRAAVPGSIIRFYLETEGSMGVFSLLPSYETDVGFAWYSLSVSDADDGLRQSAIEAEESQRLSGLLTADGDRILETTPDRIRNASNLLGTLLHRENPSPTPDGWVVTDCERDVEASEFLAPRFTATFVHQESDVVLEALPEPADPPLDPTDADDTSDELSLSNPNDSDAAYRWKLSFAPDEVQEEVSYIFEERIAGQDFLQIMNEVSDLLE
jgi:hypothetical protein